MSDNAIQVDGVSKNFVLPHEKKRSVKSIFTSMFREGGKSEMQHALHGIDFEVKKGEFFGIVGRNGSGKSTLLKILAGIYQPSHGKVKTKGKLVPFIELGVGFNPELTGRENVYLNGALLGFSKKEIDAQYDDIVKFAELERFMDQKLKNYSSGMQVRLAFSLATRAEADILLVDEVLAVGDADFQRKCFEYFKKLKANKKTVVFVTHDMGAVREYCTRAMLIDKSEIQMIGEPQEIAQEYAMLFMDNASDHAKKGDGKRFGNGDVYVTDVKTKVQKDDIIITVKAKVKKPVDRVIYGLHVMGEDGAEITAMNNRMIHKDDVQSPEVGSTITFEWNVLNVFNDGNYYVMLTLVDDVANTLDWFVKADSFTVKRQDRSTTAVLPPVKVDYSVKK
ncbi:MAG: ABC transporter ATP-binding protein [Candidatus Woesebacteria bacterium]|jgi:ABC-2 type transport system ATP-binding protein